MGEIVGLGKSLEQLLLLEVIGVGARNAQVLEKGERIRKPIGQRRDGRVREVEGTQGARGWRAHEGVNGR